MQRPRRLVPNTWLRAIVVMANLAVFPVWFVAATSWGMADESTRPDIWITLSIAVPIISFAALIAWSGIASLNAGRARPMVRHQRKPSSIGTALSWFVPLSVVVVIGVGLSVIGSVAGETRETIDRGDGDGEMVVFAMGALLVIAVLLATYRPFAVLGRVSRWVSGDHVRFRNWFLAPFVGAMSGATLAGFYALIGLGESGVSNAWVGAAVLTVATSLPWICWVIIGNRAMADLEAATQLAHRRRVDDARAAAAQAAAAAAAAASE